MWGVTERSEQSSITLCSQSLYLHSLELNLRDARWTAPCCPSLQTCFIVKFSTEENMILLKHQLLIKVVAMDQLSLAQMIRGGLSGKDP